MSFQINDKVKFKTDDIRIPKFVTEQGTVIPPDMIKHGNTVFKKNEGVIKGIFPPYYVVRYEDTNNKFVQLGFKEEDLVLLKKGRKVKEMEIEEKKSPYYVLPVELAKLLNCKTKEQLEIKIFEAISKVYNIKINESLDVEDLKKEFKKLGLKI